MVIILLLFNFFISQNKPVLRRQCTSENYISKVSVWKKLILLDWKWDSSKLPLQSKFRLSYVPYSINVRFDFNLFSDINGSVYSRIILHFNQNRIMADNVT